MGEPMDHEDFEAWILCFEQAWQRESPPVIAEFLPASLSPADRLRWLCELVSLDLEYRWRLPEDSDHAARFQVEDYLHQFPELGDSPARVLELIGEEYRARHCRGDKPRPAEFLARFETLQAEILCTLQQVDQELETECETASAPRPTVANIPADSSGETFDPRAPLPYRDYVLQRLIGAGGMGKVYRAWQQSLDRPVAVKFLRKSFLSDDRAIGRFLEEARTVARFQHPNIIGVHGLGRTPGGGYFLVMDWIDGPDLAEIIRRGPVPISQAVRWTIEASEAISEAHRHGIVHCDLKPGNILLAPPGRVRVTDFGMARSLTDDTRPEEGMEGTAPFMAPEQISASWGPIGPRTDVYGLGTVLYTLLTGQPPWTGRTLADVLAGAVSATPVASPETHRSPLPAGLIETCRRCLSKSPASRYADVAELRQSLEANLAHCGHGE